MLFTAWRSFESFGEEGRTYLFVEGLSPPNERTDLERLVTIEASSYEEARKTYYKMMGWPYDELDAVNNELASMHDPYEDLPY